MGYRSGQNNTTGRSNVFLGFESGVTNGVGQFNTIVGSQAGRSNRSGSSNVLVGTSAGENTLDADNQVFLGSSAGRSSVGGGNSVVIGDGAGFIDTAITNSVYIGYAAGQLPSNKVLSRSGNVFIGNFAGYDQEEDNRLFIANSSVGKTEALLYGEFDSGLLRVNGDLQIAANAATGNSRLFMKGVGGNLNEVIRYDGDRNDVVMGSVTGAGGKLFLRSDGATRMSVIENGNVGIGTTNPTQNLHVEGNGYFSNFVIVEEELFINNVIAGAGTSDLKYNAATGRITSSTSDMRLKRDIKTIDNALEKIKSLRGVSFYWKDHPHDQPQLGLIAQEVKEILPEVVSENKNGYYGVDYSETIGVFVEAMKEQQAKTKSRNK